MADERWRWVVEDTANFERSAAGLSRSSHNGMGTLESFQRDALLERAAAEANALPSLLREAVEPGAGAGRGVGDQGGIIRNVGLEDLGPVHEVGGGLEFVSGAGYAVDQESALPTGRGGEDLEPDPLREIHVINPPGVETPGGVLIF